MLQSSDLETFLEHFRAAQNIIQSMPSETTIDAVKSTEGTLFSAELGTLYRSLAIAATMGRCETEAAEVLRAIIGQGQGARFVALNDADAWRAAIVWGIRQRDSGGESRVDVYRRQKAVGAACSRLRQRGHIVNINSYGPDLDENSKKSLVTQVDNLVRLIGGHEVINQVLGIMHGNNLIHDGMWLFGDRVPGFQDAGRPATPYGWLLSLGIKRLGCPATARKPDVAWKTLIGLATDFAATYDCQRYGQFEEMDIHPSDFHRVISNSLLWRELFSLPQVPPSVLPTIFSVLDNIFTQADRSSLGADFFQMKGELLRLTASIPSDKAARIGVEEAQRHFPALWRHARGKLGDVNRDYADPTKPNVRNQDSKIIFEMRPDEAFLLPSSMTASAACEVLFRTIWSKLPRKRAEEIVGSTFELAISRACEGKAPRVFSTEKYHVGKQVFEIDAATRDGDRIVLFETKAKSLTANARSGDQASFFSDFADSYLAMLEQLARHEDHLNRGLTPLTDEGEETNFRPLKVAVSPLSYGPITDKVLASTIVRAIIRGKFEAKVPDKALEKAVKKFNEGVSSVSELLIQLSPSDLEGLKDVHSYLIDVFWVDLGQLIYVLKRSTNTWDALRPLKHMTHSTRDFWTEVAYADRGGLSAGNWAAVAA